MKPVVYELLTNADLFECIHIPNTDEIVVSMAEFDCRGLIVATW